jgi:hypothetical protein
MAPGPEKGDKLLGPAGKKQKEKEGGLKMDMTKAEEEPTPLVRLPPHPRPRSPRGAWSPAQHRFGPLCSSAVVWSLRVRCE